jgi:hypothetical protein
MSAPPPFPIPDSNPLSIDVASLRQNTLFNTALSELETHRSISRAIADAILAKPEPPKGLASFLLVLVQNTVGDVRLTLGMYAVDCIDKFDVGYEAIDYCLSPNALTVYQRSNLGSHLVHINRPEVIPWAHARLTQDIRDDLCYHSFLTKHAEFIFACLDRDMTVYLLTPKRGPGNLLLDTFMHVAINYPKPAPFINRIRVWLYDGEFDISPGGGHPPYTRVFYYYMDKVSALASGHPLQALRTEISDHVARMFTDTDTIKVGLFHLWSMFEISYHDFRSVLSRIDELPQGVDKRISNFFLDLKNGNLPELPSWLFSKDEGSSNNA